MAFISKAKYPDAIKRCPKCDADCERDEVDIGVGIQTGPWRCLECGWAEDWPYTDEDDPAQQVKVECNCAGDESVGDPHAPDCPWWQGEETDDG